MASTPTRPTSVTAFGWMIVLGSAFLVVSAFDRVSSLSSLDSRQQVEEFLAEPPGDGLGIGLETALDLLHALSVVTGGCAAAAAVLGFFALRRSRGARIGLTVVAVPMFLAGFVLGGLLSALVAAGTVALWLQPARDWFDGHDRPRPPAGNPFGGSREERDRRGRGDRSGDQQDEGSREDEGSGEDEHRPEDEHAQHRERRPAHQGAGPEPTRPMGDPGPGDGPGPRAYVGFGQPGSVPAEGAGPAPGQDPTAERPGTYPVSQPGWVPPGQSRPGAVVVACVLTWATCAVAGAIMLATVVALAASPETLLEEVRRQNPEVGAEVTRSTLVGVTVGVGAALVLWCVAASVLAFFVIRGQDWARITLAVSATVAALGAAVLAIGSVAMLVPAATAGAAAYCLLFRSDVRSWFTHP